MNQVVDGASPLPTGLLIAVVVGHAAGGGRKQRNVGAALLLKAQLPIADRVTNLVVGDGQLLGKGGARAGNLALAPLPQLQRCGRVVPVDVDDHPPAMVLAPLASASLSNFKRRCSLSRWEL